MVDCFKSKLISEKIMGQTVKDPRVSKERGNPLGAKQDSLTVASDTAAKDLVGANGVFGIYGSRARMS